jgi:tetratricopeptide (TPR) repeat protein
MLGAISMLEGDLDGAERSYKQALAITPAFVEALANLGLIAALRDDDRSAEEWYRKATAADPTFPIAYRRMGDLYYDRRDFRKALGYYQQALKEQPAGFTAALQAGNSARRLGDAKGAEEYFARAAKAKPTSWVPGYNRACLAAATGAPAKALQILSSLPGFSRTQLLEHDPDLASIRALPGYSALLHQVKDAAREKRRAARDEENEEPVDDFD